MVSRYYHDTLILTWYPDTIVLSWYDHNTLILSWYPNMIIVSWYYHNILMLSWYFSTIMMSQYNHDILILSWYLDTIMVSQYNHAHDWCLLCFSPIVRNSIKKCWEKVHSNNANVSFTGSRQANKTGKRASEPVKCYSGVQKIMVLFSQ